MNNLGYRSDEDYSVDAFRGKKLVLCFGCTDTLGMHDIKENTWPYILPNHIDSQYKVLNLGVIGASRDTIARLLIKLTGVLSDEINHVCILWPHPNRREFVSKEYTKIITSHDKHNLPYEEYWDYIDWRSNNYNMMKNKHLIKNVCSLNNIQLSDLEIERFDSKVPFDFSGEYNAFGRNTHTAIASYFAKIINGEESLFKKISS
jgi:hypothetical protein